MGYPLPAFGKASIQNKTKNKIPIFLGENLVKLQAHVNAKGHGMALYEPMLPNLVKRRV